MTRLARLLLSTTLLLLAACGFNDAQKTAFVRAMTEAILNATDTSSVIAVRNAVVMTGPAGANINAAHDATPLICTKVEIARKCQKQSRTRVARETASLSQPVELQSVRLRLASVHHATAARVRCEIAAASEAVRGSSAARQFVFSMQTITHDAGTPVPRATQFVICTDRDLVNQTGFALETAGG